MERIGVRELRQQASRWLARVTAGESIEITDRGRLVAVLTPPREISQRERLLETGRLIPARQDLRKVAPLLQANLSKAASASRGSRGKVATGQVARQKSLSEELTDLRGEER